MLKGIAKHCLTHAAAHLGPHRFNAKGSSLWIMMYHRILPADDVRYTLEEPGMIVEPDTFHMHLRELKKHFDIVRFSEWLDHIKNGHPLPKRCCVITFDDGWYDNLEFGLPLLQQENVPATLFAVVDKIGTEFQFWPNIVSLLLSSDNRNTLTVEPIFSKAFSVLGEPPQKIDREYTASLIHHLKQYDDHLLYSMLERLEWKRRVSIDIPRALMKWDELQRMEKSGLVDIGCHTATHQRLDAQLTSDTLVNEIVSSRETLSKHIEKPVDIFCFPNGDYNPAALELVKQHYDAAVTTKRGIVTPAAKDLHQLTRIGIHQHVSATPTQLRARLSGWL